MPNTYTANVKLAMPGSGDTGWNAPVNANCQAVDALAPVGGLAVTTHEQPSASLKVDVAAGSYQRQDGTIGNFAGVASYAVAASSTSYLYIDLTGSGALTASTSAFPATAHVRLAVVAAGPSTVSSITDARVAFQVLGSILDGTALTAGTSSGLQIGTATSQKLGFFGHTPAVQPTMGAATAGLSYTSTEQGMLQAVYNAVRALGLGS
jgi:hypothetical protein